MNKGGAPKGNNNAGKNKAWSDAVRKALMAEHEPDKKKLHKLAEKLVDMAIEGDMQAIRECGDRMDGKAQQGITLADDENKPLVCRIEQVIVDPKDKSNP